MICKDEAELHEEYARVIRMCKGTGVKPEDCIRHKYGKMNEYWCFDKSPSEYSFAIAIVEDRPVFESALSWNPPKKKTFMLNGEELPLPDGGDGHSGYRIAIASVHFWNRWDDAEKVQSAIDKLLSGE